MIAFLWNLIIGQFCRHRWRIIGKGPWRNEVGESGTYYHLQCGECGKIKSKRM